MRTPPLHYFDTFESLCNFLDDRSIFTMRMGLGNIDKILNAIDLKRPPFFLIQIVGTNGKGSTCTFTSSLLQSYGLKVGLNSSPHFLSFKERVLVQGEQLSEKKWLQAANTLMQGGGEELSYFEFITALALLIFSEEKVDIAIMETGLGGSLDAVSAIKNDLVVFTPIDLDHTHILGENIVSIAKDKAGAIRGPMPVLSTAQDPRVQEVLLETSQQKKAPLFFCIQSPAEQSGVKKELDHTVKIHWPTENGEKPELGLKGSYQYDNAALALGAARLSNKLLAKARDQRTLSIEEKHILEQGENKEAELRALQAAWLPGRAQLVQPIPSSSIGQGLNLPHGLPYLLLDGGHNPHGLKNLSKSLAEQGIAPIATIFSCLRDKDAESMLAHVRVLSTGPIFIPPIENNPRAFQSGDLAQLCGTNAIACESLAQALEQSAELAQQRFPASFREEGKTHPILICGSLYLLAAFYQFFPEQLNAVKK